VSDGNKKLLFPFRRYNYLLISLLNHPRAHHKREDAHAARVFDALCASLFSAMIDTGDGASSIGVR
jgi:hypothetical protein